MNGKDTSAFKILTGNYINRMEEIRNTFEILRGKPTGKRPLRIPSNRWEDNNRMDIKEIGVNTRN